MAFFGFGMFVIGMIVGRVTMAVQYEVMKTISKDKPEKPRKKKFPEPKKPARLEYGSKDDSSARKGFYDYMKRR